MPKQPTKEELFEMLKGHFSDMGKKGGASRSAKKVKAARKNAKKYRTEAQRLEARRETQRRYWQKKKGTAQVEEKSAE